MAVETSLSKLQNQVDKLQKENTKLRDLLTDQKKNRNLQNQIKYMEKTIEEKISKAVDKFASYLIEENKKLKE